MTQVLDLSDIQGGILRDYGGDFPKCRYFFLHISDPAAGRAFVRELRRKVTSALRWVSKAVQYPGDILAEKPPVVINVAFTFYGLLALELPTRTLREMPPEFIDGMAARATILGDTGPSSPKNWDPLWRRHARLEDPTGQGASGMAAMSRRDPNVVHVAVGMRAKMNPDGAPVQALEDETTALRTLCSRHNVTILRGNGRDNAEYQEMAALGFKRTDGVFQNLPIEHFGFTDGISEVAFELQGADQRIPGGGKIVPDGSWEPIETGEFLLGHSDEAQEIRQLPEPKAFVRNGTFMAYRKLHENVAAFNGYIAEAARTYAKVMDVDVKDASDIIKAKMVGRWPDGVPLMAAPTLADRKAFAARAAAQTDEFKRWVPMVDFRYKDDPQGLKCPLTAHIRRVIGGVDRSEFSGGYFG